MREMRIEHALRGPDVLYLQIVMHTPSEYDPVDMASPRR
jgi:hypothetical protein